MNILTIILYEKLHRYVYDNYFDLKKKNNTKTEIFWYKVYCLLEKHFKGWRLILKTWFPNKDKYKRYSPKKLDFSEYEINQLGYITTKLYRYRLRKS